MMYESRAPEDCLSASPCARLEPRPLGDEKSGRHELVDLANAGKSVTLGDSE